MYSRQHLYLCYYPPSTNFKRIDNQNTGSIHFVLFIAAMQFMKIFNWYSNLVSPKNDEYIIIKQKARYGKFIGFRCIIFISSWFLLNFLAILNL